MGNKIKEKATNWPPFLFPRYDLNLSQNPLNKIEGNHRAICGTISTPAKTTPCNKIKGITPLYICIKVISGGLIPLR